MASFDNFDIYHLEKLDENDPFVQIYVWRHYFKLKSGVFRCFGEGVKNVLIEIDRMLKWFANNKICNYSQAKLEREYAVFRDIDKAIAEEALHDSKIFTDIKTSLDEYRDEEKDYLILKNFEQRLKDARKAFYDQFDKTDLFKEKYHKKAFEAEKAEIKKKIAEKEDEIRRCTERFELLQEKIGRSIEKYKEEFNKLKVAGNCLKEESKKYTEARKKVDFKRASHILGQLKKYASEAYMKHEDLEDVNFDGVRIMEVINSRLPQESIIIKKMERYRGTTNKEELIKQMKLELERERRKREVLEDENRVIGLTQTDNDAVPGTSEISCGSVAGKRYLITKAYRKEAANQISLTQGKYVKMIMPANSKGLAFGEKRGAFGRKKKGYFPVSCVTPAD